MGGICINYFESNYNNIKYPRESKNKNGLRNAQIGAIHAISSNDTLNETSTSIIVMPTGTGKTSVVMMAPYVLRKKKVLIITPSIMVRLQICDDYKKLSTLKRIGVFEENITPPKILELKHKYNQNDRENILRADVVVATPQVGESISSDEIVTNFDYLIIDEAHHVPAKTWQTIINNMKNIDHLLVTATPFRLDKKEIVGKIIYNYPLSKAVDDGIFGEILFIPVPSSENKDLTIAKEVERVFNNDKNSGLEHYIMARTNTKEKAKKLEDIYSNNTSLNLMRVDSSMSENRINGILNKLKDGILDGIICVDMLGEGFDFPNLKIAAIHEPKKSLASTLQFVGRFARTNANNIGQAKFIAMNDEEFKVENYKLFSNDAIWHEIVINMSEDIVSSETEERIILENFSKPNTPVAISLDRIRPNCHAKVYKVQDFNINGTFPKELNVDDVKYVNEDNNTVVAISKNYSTPLWSNDNNIVNIEIELYIIHYQTDTNLVFIYSPHKTEYVYELIIKSFSQNYNQIPRHRMNKVLADYKKYEFYNTGMQNRYSERGESYRIYSGSNTASSIDENTGRLLSAGHAFCKVEKDDIEKTIGYSSGSKVWSNSYVSLYEYIKWCDEVGSKISDDNLKVVTNTNYDILPLPEEFTHYQENIIFVILSDKTYNSSPKLFKKDDEKITELLIDANLKLIKVDKDLKKVIFSVTIMDFEEKFTCDTYGKYESIEGDIFCCLDGKDKFKLSDYFNSNPLIFKASDDTNYSGFEVLKGHENIELFPNDRIIPFDWNYFGVHESIECDIKVSNSIHCGINKYLLQNINYSHIIYDHGSGEIADFITLQEKEDELEISLYHCKSKKATDYNSAVNDVYEVAQQAVKSTIWVRKKSILLNKINDRIKNSEVKEKFIKGEYETFKNILNKNKFMRVKIYVVQPSISKSKELPEKISVLLSSTNMFLKNMGNVSEFNVFGSM